MFELNMKILVTISLSLLVFIQSIGMGVSDVFMFADLVSHAKFHAEEYGDDFFTFFEKHYGSLKEEHHQKHQEEDTQHENLPFQHSTTSHLIPEVVLFSDDFSIKNTGIFSEEKAYFHYRATYSSIDRTTPFQPPKNA